jgi:hypothetical protein
MSSGMENYWAARSAPRPEFTQAQQDQRPRVVASFATNPATIDTQGTGKLLDSRRPRKAGVRALGGLPEVESPLDTSGHQAIIDASGLGPGLGREPAERSAVEDSMSDADPQRPPTSGDLGAVDNEQAPLTARIRAGVQAGRAYASQQRASADYFAEGS